MRPSCALGREHHVPLTLLIRATQLMINILLGYPNVEKHSAYSPLFPRSRGKLWAGYNRCKTETRESLLTCAAGDVDINADVRYATSFQRRDTRVRPKVCEFQVNDVQVGGARRHVGVGLCDDHPFRASQGPPIFKPAEGELLRRDSFHLAGDFHLSPNLDVVIFVIWIRSDPETSFF